MANAANTNQMVDALIKMLMNQKLMKQRFGHERSLLGERQEGYKELEGLRTAGDIDLAGTRHGFKMEEIADQWHKSLSRDPKTKQMVAQIYEGERSGRDMSTEKAELKGRNIASGEALFRTTTGQDTVPQDFTTLLENQSEQLVGQTVGQFGASYRQEKDIEEVRKPEQKLRAGELQTKWAGLQLDADKAQREQNKEWVAYVVDVTDHLQSEGVTGEGLGMSLFGSGKVTDPLSPENRGKALSELSRIRQKLMGQQSLDNYERNFLNTIWNTFAIEGTSNLIEKPGGFPTRESGGFTPTGVDSRMIDQIVIDIEEKEALKGPYDMRLEPDQIRQKAIEYYNKRLKR